MKKITLIISLIVLSQIAIFGQGTCLQNTKFLKTTNGVGYPNAQDMTNTNTAPWLVANGSPSGDAFGNTAGGLFMWSYSGGGEGIYTNFNFKKGKRYVICFTYYAIGGQASPPIIIANANFYFRAVNNLVPTFTGTSTGNPIPAVPSQNQTIFQGIFDKPNFVNQTVTYVPDNDYSQLWIYPEMLSYPSGSQAELVIKEIRITEPSYVSGTTDICVGGSTELKIEGDQSGSYTWSPATGLNTTTGTTVIASPTTTTTYTVTKTANTTGSCLTCGDQFSVTVNVGSGTPINGVLCIMGNGTNAAVSGSVNQSIRETAWAGYFDGRGYFSNKVGIGTNIMPSTLAKNSTHSFENGILPMTNRSFANYNLFVKGGILTEEISLKSSWADYVFDKKYALKPLDEVEEFININKHLPNTPSAKSIEENGLNVGNIAVLQQEKIEEIFLHLISLSKEVKALQVKNKELEKQIIEKK